MRMPIVFILAVALVGVVACGEIATPTPVPDVATPTMPPETPTSRPPTFTPIVEPTSTARPDLKTPEPLLAITPAPTPTVVPIPEFIPAEIGDTIPGVGYWGEAVGFDMTLLSCQESAKVVLGPYSGGYYTFTARPGMKFILLNYRFYNDRTKEQRTPYLSEGEVRTNLGINYKVWQPIDGIWTEGYDARPATEEELIALDGSASAYKILLPEESARGRVVFKIPTDQSPTEVVLKSVTVPIRLKDCAPVPTSPPTLGVDIIEESQPMD